MSDDQEQNHILLSMNTVLGGPEVSEYFSPLFRQICMIFTPFEGLDYLKTLTGFSLWIRVGGSLADYSSGPGPVRLYKKEKRLGMSLNIGRADWERRSVSEIRKVYASAISSCFNPLLKRCRREGEIIDEDRLIEVLEGNIELFLREPD